jgi:TetR/AcrR family transcriptional regulator, acrAB operon repressor
MARRTKEEAAATRDSILDAAEQLFSEQGVSRTTLQHIATAAGVTRGAIYWHFDDKVALFDAMMERVIMPLESTLSRVDDAGAIVSPLSDLFEYMMAGLRKTVEDARARRVFAIAALKMEFVGELEAATVRRSACLDGWMVRAEARIQLAATRGELRGGIDPRAAALAMWALVDGLIRSWLFDPEAFDLLQVGAQAVQAQINGLKNPQAA